MKLDEFYSIVKPLFFAEDDVGNFGIANASGIPFELDNSTWNLQESHGPRSKLRIYLLYYPVRHDYNYYYVIVNKVMWLYFYFHFNLH